MDAVRRAKFEKLLDETRQDIRQVDEQVERELAEVKQRLAGMQSEKEAQLIIYEGYCQLLGVPNELTEEDDELED